ncbi:hypothetical protein [Salinactinospora qingdaonensis]|uniref:Uncharacterized protein n=1 Tax=Salinactinospora qingdaonensis TaxID=702744 RepID=A0ABP7F2N3_9ACTN
MKGPAMGHALVSARDRFSTGLPGRQVPVSTAEPTEHRPWGMDRAVVPLPVELAGKHEKPTENRAEKKKTQYQNDGKLETDQIAQTSTD